jgi:hypothetical protein
MAEEEEIGLIFVSLEIGGDQSLFILLGTDGLINRKGNGSVDHIERAMFIGKVPPDLFLQLRSRITPGVIYFLGQRLAAPKPKGKLCELNVGFKYVDGREAVSGWRYGSESQGPHPEVCEFVRAAVEITEPWFQRERDKVHRYNAD